MKVERQELEEISLVSRQLFVRGAAQLELFRSAAVSEIKHHLISFDNFCALSVTVAKNDMRGVVETHRRKLLVTPI